MADSLAILLRKSLLRQYFWRTSKVQLGYILSPRVGTWPKRCHFWPVVFCLCLRISLTQYCLHLQGSHALLHTVLGSCFSRSALHLKARDFATWGKPWLHVSV